MIEKSEYKDKRRRRVKLIFNPNSGKVKYSGANLMDIISQMQESKLVPETFILEPDSDLPKMVSDTRLQGISMFVAGGGDGTVSAVAKAITGLPVTLGIIPMGTQNNIARSLCIPHNIPDSIAALRYGRRIKIDMGEITLGSTVIPFLELCSIGIASSIFPSADSIQHGHLEKIGDFLTALISSAPSDIKLTFDGHDSFIATGQAVIITNMPYIGRHCRLGDSKAYRDGRLDVMFFGDLPKLNLIGFALSRFDKNQIEDPRIHSFQTRSLDIDAFPSMPIMSDGVMLGDGPIHIEIKPGCLGVMTT